MTIKQLQKRVDAALEVLRPMGLGHWIIHLSIADEVRHEHASDAAAACQCSSHYDEMWLEFRADVLESYSEQEIDRLIFHELLHAGMRDLDHAIGTVDQFLGEPHKSAWDDEIDHAREGFIERLARSFAYTLNKNVVR